MTDALRSDRSSPLRETPDRERDARVDDLLLSGLDHYFAGQYELAINVWTRVLFLDRGHARARAYIERARSAVAERQREADELLHAGAAALDQGNRAIARQLLTTAVERGAGGEEALALLQRLDRLDAASTGVPARPVDSGRPRLSLADGGHPPAAGRGRAARDLRLVWLAGGLGTGVLLAIVATGYLWIVAEPIELGTPGASPPALLADPLPVPTPGEIRMLRARNLVASGRFHDALALLEAGPVDEPYRQDADELRAAIQRRLIAAGLPQTEPPPSAAPAVGGAPR